MSQSERLLKQAGYKQTPPRQLVAKILESNPQHLTANEIWEQVQAQDSNIGRMSVYRTLELFTQIGYIRPAPQSAAAARTGVVYVLMRDGHHHHIVCTVCNRMIEFEDCGLGSLIATLEKRFDFLISGHLLELYGICAECQKQE